MAEVADAAKDIVTLLMASYTEPGGRISAETVIGAAAALAGEFALRSTGATLPKAPAYIFGGVADGILYADAERNLATVWQGIQDAALSSGVPRHELPSPTDIVAQVAAAAGKSPFPPLTVPRQHWPREYSPNAGPRFRQKILAIAERHGLGLRDAALALGMATGLLIRLTHEVFRPTIAARLAAEIAVGVSRMAPLERPIG